LLLLRHENHTKAALTDLLQQLVTAGYQGADAFGERDIIPCLFERSWLRGRPVEEMVGAVVGPQQGLNPLAQGGIARAHLSQIAGTLNRGGELHSGGENRLDAVVGLGHFGAHTQIAVYLNKRCLAAARLTDSENYSPFSSRALMSQARAKVQ